MLSKNPLNGKIHEVPDPLTDRVGIDCFLSRQSGKRVVVVQGLGFVGAVMSLVVANALTEEYAVVGVDMPSPNSYWKIVGINEGDFPVTASDPKIDEYYASARTKGNLYATFDPYCYEKANVIIVDINLDVAKHANFESDLNSFEVDLAPFKAAIGVIGKFCKPDVLVLVETTVPPGACEKIVSPILQSHLVERGLPADQFKLGHSYERVMPGPDYVDSIQNFYRVYAGIDESSAIATESFLRTIISTDRYALTRLSNTTSTEMAKVLENSYRAMNIAFMVEWSRFAEDAGVNLYEVVKAIRMRPTHQNMMLPGVGVGGYCLTKDPLLASWAKTKLFDSPQPLAQSEQGVRINDKMPLYAFRFLQSEYEGELAGKRVLLLGVSYRSKVGDTRYTPVEPLYDYLERAGCTLEVTDPYVTYWEEKAMHVGGNFLSMVQSCPDIVVISTGHTEYANNTHLIGALLELPTVFVVDTVGLFSETEIQLIASKHRVRVLGRGDISMKFG